MKVGIYVRQSVQQDQGITQQIEICKRRAKAEEWEVIEVYRDNNTSATKARGEGTAWSRMLADVDAGRMDVILCVAAARLLRRTVDVIEVTKPKRSVRVVTVRDGIDTATMGGRVMLAVLVAMAEEEIAEKEARALPYRQSRNANGHPSPGKVPYGYGWVPSLRRGEDGRRYEIVPEESAAVRFVFAEVIAGSPLGMVARELNEGTARDPRTGHVLAASTRKTRKGTLWIPTTVRRIALSPMYAALLPPIVPGAGEYRAEAVDLDACTLGVWEPIVEENVVRAARSVLIDPSRRTHQGTSRRWLLSGLAVCDVCGQKVRSARTKERYHGYRCPAGHFQRSGEIMDRYVEQVVVERLSAPDAVSLIQPAQGVDLDALRAQEGALRGRRASLLDLAASGTFDAAEVREKVAPIDAELAEVTATIGAALAVDPFASVVTASDVRAAWEALTLARKRRIVSELFVLVIRPVGKGVRVTTLEQAAASVDVIWNRPGRFKVALPSLVNEALVAAEMDSYSTLSSGVRAALAHALDA
ncbi:recombinase family protein [Microbacterium testaceum]|uniref:recombinase family protein n=1 Tax=Microbacterium testaceum TaxID=2033 RepID=UPI0038121F65